VRAEKNPARGVTQYRHESAAIRTASPEIVNETEWIDRAPCEGFVEAPKANDVHVEADRSCSQKIQFQLRQRQW